MSSRPFNLPFNMAILSKLVHSTQLTATRALSSSLPLANAATVITPPTLQTPNDIKANQLEAEWKNNPRWNGVKRDYTAKDVLKLRTSIKIEHSLAKRGSDRLWKMLTKEEPYVHALGALTGNQAVQQVKAGLKAIYLSGWQVAADANLAGDMYPDLR